MFVEPTLIKQIWPKIWPLIEDIVVLETQDELLADLVAGNRIMIIIGDGVSIVRDCGGFLEINYVAGKNIKKWKDQMDSAILAVAKSFGCDKIAALGKRGWKKIWPDYEMTNQVLFIRRVV